MRAIPEPVCLWPLVVMRSFVFLLLILPERIPLKQKWLDDDFNTSWARSPGMFHATTKI
jgi:hypothetical protein